MDGGVVVVAVEDVVVIGASVVVVVVATAAAGVWAGPRSVWGVHAEPFQCRIKISGVP
jgi:hypothetical protein